MIAQTVLNDVLFPIVPANTTLAAGAVSGILSALGAAKGLIFTLIIGMIVLALLIVAFRWLMKHREKIKGRAFVGQMMGVLRGTPQAIADPAARAELEDMRKKFEDGVEKYRSNGKDLYKLPWYLLVGPPASGKTEMMRHCNIGFPPGLHDYLQGVGGTLNMNWWFANQGIVVDTAGKMLMKEVGSGESSLWKELLAMLKRVRPQQPINGMILCISVDSLIKDSADQIEQKAGTIARQLDVIQRTLDIRFPVYIVVTKCDLITGFREFFERVTDPALQHQMVGWSNPAELDTPFNPESVDQHIEQVRQRLIRRRFSLVVDPVHTEDPQARRTDQVDALFALPESLSRLSSRLRRYLELIFVAGEWSPKPLFLRGIYFTSSMRQGAELDEEVAKIMGIGVDALPGGGMAEEKSYFIRDTLLSKVFKERGLVTRATNVDQQQRKRKLIVVGTGIVALAALLAIAAASLWNFYSSIGKPQEQWASIARWYSTKGNDVLDASTSKPTFDPTEDIVIGADKVSRVGMLDRSLTLAKIPIKAPLVIRPLVSAQDLLSESVAQQSRDAHAVVVGRVGLANLVEQARGKMAKVSGAEWNEDATGVLAGLLNIQRGITPPKAREVDRGEDHSQAAKDAARDAPPEFKQPLHVRRFLGFVLSDEEMLRAKPQVEEFQAVVEETYGSEVGATWPPAAVVVRDPEAVAKGVAAFNDYWQNHATKKSFGEIDELRRLTIGFGQNEAALVDAVAKLRVANVTPEKYAEFRASWAKGVKSLADFEAGIARLLKEKPGLAKIPEILDRESTRIKNRAEEEYRVVLGEEPPSALEKLADSALDRLADKGTEALDRKTAKATGGKSGLDLKASLDTWKPELEGLRQDLLAARKKVSGSAIDAEVASLRGYFTGTGEGARLLAEVKGNKADYAFAARSRAYQVVAKAIASSTDDSAAWGEARSRSDAVSSEMDRAFNEAKEKLVGLPADQAAGGVSAESLGFVLTNAAARSGRTGVVRALASKVLDPSSDSVGALVSGASQADRTFAIAMVGGPTNSLTIDRRYDHEAAGRVVADLAFLASAGGAKGALPGDVPNPGPAFLDDEAVTSSAVTAQRAMVAYLAKYTAYWTSGLLSALEITAPTKWSEFGPAMVKANEATAVGAELVKLSKLVEQALAIDMGGQVASAEVVKWREAAKADGEAAEAAQRVARAIDPWRGLPSEARAARLYVGNLTRTEFSARYVQELKTATDARTPMGPMSRYLDLVRLKALDVLGREARTEWGLLRERLAGGTMIPLSMVREDSPRKPRPVTAKRELVKECNDLMPRTLVVRTADEDKVRSGKSIGNPEVDQRLGVLFGRDTSQGQDKLFSSLGVWLPVVLGESEKLSCDVVVPETAEIGKPAKVLDGMGLKNAYGTNLGTVASTGPSDAVKRTDQAEAGQALASGLQVPGSGALKLTSHLLVGDDKAQGTREVGSDWSVLELLAEPDARAIDAEGKRWLVPVVYFGDAGPVFYKWVELRFSAPLPPRKDWPTVQLWK